MKNVYEIRIGNLREHTKIYRNILTKKIKNYQGHKSK